MFVVYGHNRKEVTGSNLDSTQTPSSPSLHTRSRDTRRMSNKQKRVNFTDGSRYQKYHIKIDILEQKKNVCLKIGIRDISLLLFTFPSTRSLRPRTRGGKSRESNTFCQLDVFNLVPQSSCQTSGDCETVSDYFQVPFTRTLRFTQVLLGHTRGVPDTYKYKPTGVGLGMGTSLPLETRCFLTWCPCVGKRKVKR